jgi:hypothetical protein
MLMSYLSITVSALPAIQSLMEGHHKDLKVPPLSLQFPSNLGSEFEAFMVHKKIDPYVQGGGLDLVQFLKLYNFSLELLGSFDFSSLLSNNDILDSFNGLVKEQDQILKAIEGSKEALRVLQTRSMEENPEKEG